MKTLMTLFLVLLNFAYSLAQISPSTDQNYILTRKYKIPTKTSFPSPSPDQAKVDITYFDGLGRPIQHIANQQSNSGKDIITPIKYDNFGRQTREYLPFVSSTNDIKYNSNAFTDVDAYYNSPKYENTLNPYSEKQLEASPLNRVLKQAAPGNSWALNSGHEIGFDYQTNTNIEVKFFQALASGANLANTGLYEISLSQIGNYPANLLYKTITKDENWTSGNNNTTEEFKNQLGEVILKRTYSNYVPHDTYYVYDQYGNLTYVIPPNADGAITTQVLNDLCYQYKYDARNRLVEKKLPGKQWEFIVYDKLDRAVMTGPAFSPFKEDPNIGWNITKYDAFNRPVYTGWYSGLQPNSNNRVSLQNMQNLPATVVSEKRTSTTTNIGNIAVAYTNVTEPKIGFYLLSVNYYDDYKFPRAAFIIPQRIFSQPVARDVKALLTGTWTRTLTSYGEFNGQASTILYDLKGRSIRNQTINYLGGYNYIDSELSFAGKTLNTVTTHKLSSSSSVILKLTNTYSYTPQMRLKTHSNQINTLPIQLISKNEYDELGQLIVKRVGGTDTTGLTSLQKVDYSYNIRGWLTGINNDITNKLVLNNSENDLFGFKINYNTSEDEINYTGTPLYNGNISETYWRTKTDNSLKKYGYQYDNLNRLTNAIYQKPGSGTVVTNAYNERLGYDKNGNIIGLQRNGKRDEAFVGIDNLGYAYQGNQLKGVRDFSQHPEGFIDDNNNSMDDYRYDANGNLILDANKKISSIVYNHLNLPVRITFSSIVTTYQGSTTPYANIDYIYTANGEKLEKTVTINGVSTNTKYIDGFNYLNNVLQFFPTTEGYVSYKGGAYNYVFNYTDHLGNVRLSYQDKNKNGNISSVDEILEENNYYPFGLKQEGENAINGQPNYKYKYNGKELQDENIGGNQLNLYDYGARNYDPALGRWMNIDPLAETSRRFNPYTYALNNPIYFIDPDGMQADDWKTDKNGNLTYDPFLTKNNASDRLAEGEKYIGTTATENVSNDAGNYTLTYNDDGSISSSNNNYGGDFPVISESSESNNSERETAQSLEGSTLALTGLGLEVAKENIGATFRLMNKNSTNFSPKLYTSGWTGGSVGRITTYNLGVTAGKIGTGVGLYSLGMTGINVARGDISAQQGAVDGVFGAIGTFGGWKGAVIGASYELGKVVGPSTWYGNDNTKWFK